MTFVPMKNTTGTTNSWKWVFFALLPVYALYYAPFGINETDGGFLTGLAWQVLQGKVLYQDIIYVRPPLPVYSRALELMLLPESYAVLGERWIFYTKLWLYSWMAAALLTDQWRRWFLAALGFVVSVHCYPAMAWHTVDGIFWAVTSLFFLFHSTKGSTWWSIAAGLALAAAILCKQSFYPLVGIFGLGIWLSRDMRLQGKWLFVAGFGLGMGLWGLYLQQNQIFDAYLSMTNGAANSGQAFQHGVVDYFLITPELAFPSILGVLVIFYLQGKPNVPAMLPKALWALWLLALVWSFAAVTWLRQEHTAPFAQTRMMFWLAAGWGVYRIWQERKLGPSRDTLLFLLLLGISWSAAISWGYNLPLLFTTPWLWAGIQWTEYVVRGRASHWSGYFRVALFISLLATFRIGYEFIYRDGVRREMTEHLGDIFPKLGGIYSDAETADLYLNFKQLAQKHSGQFAVLPAFPQADFLSGNFPELPLDWVVNRETNGLNETVYTNADQCKVIFIEKEYLPQLNRNPELEVTKTLYERWEVVEETAHFIVIQKPDGNE